MCSWNTFRDYIPLSAIAGLNREHIVKICLIYVTGLNLPQIHGLMVKNLHSEPLAQCILSAYALQPNPSLAGMKFLLTTLFCFLHPIEEIFFHMLCQSHNRKDFFWQLPVPCDMTALGVHPCPSKQIGNVKFYLPLPCVPGATVQVQFTSE